MDKAHEVRNISFDGTIMRLSVDGRDYQVDVAAQSERLVKVTPEQRTRFEISPSGYGIHWPDIDEGLSIDGLIGVRHAAPYVELRT